MRERAEKVVNDLRELVAELQREAGNPDHAVKLQQMRAVSRSIQQLESQTIAVPDDLRRLKASLLTEVGESDEASTVLRHLIHGVMEIVRPLLAEKKRRRQGLRPGQRDGETTPPSKWRAMIQEVLRELGGRARRRDVLDRLESRMNGKLGAGDLATHDDGKPAWFSNVSNEKMRMMRDGLLKSDSPRGWWELADES